MSLTTERCRAQPVFAHLGTLLRTRRNPLAKEIGRAPSYESLTPLGGKRLELAVDHRERAAPFFARERSTEWCLARTRSAHVALAQANEHRRWPHERRRLRERLAGQCVSHTNVAVEVGQRWNGGHSRLPAFDHDGEPEAQLAEPHRGGIHVHAVNRAGEHVPPDRRHAARVACGAMEQREPLEHEDEERPGAAGGVEHRESAKPCAQAFGRLMAELLTSERGLHVVLTDVVIAQRGDQRLVRHMCDHRLRRVERTARSPLSRGHQGFKGAAEHFRIDRRLGPFCLPLAGREAVRAEQLTEERAHRVVGEAGGRVAPLQCALGKQSAVQEGNGAKPPRDVGAVAHRRVQRAEEQREQNPAMKAPSGGHACVEMPSEKSVIAVEPTLRLEKRQKEEARHAEECEFRAVRRACDVQGVRERAHALLQNAIEAARQRLAAEQLAPARVHEQVVARARGGEQAQCIRVAGDDAGAAGDEGDDSRGALSGRPAGDTDLLAVGRGANDEPEHV